MNTFGSIKEFTWDSEKVGKGEYHEWYALLTRHLSTRGIALCLKADHTEIYRPIAPVQPPPNAVAARQENYERLKATYDETMRKFHEKFDTAIGIVRASLTYASKAANDFELALQVDGDPETKFRNGMARIYEKYCPQDPTDVNSIRRKMQEITDTSCGGFHAYQSEFTRLRLQLINANSQPTETEEREWVRKGLTNSEVKRFLSTTLFRYDAPLPPIDTVFSAVRQFLSEFGDENDPYKTATTSDRTLVVAAAITPPRNGPTRFDGCTRCWRKGHNWKECIAVSCGACKADITGKQVCPNVLSHPAPKNWCPRHLSIHAVPQSSGPIVTPPQQLPPPSTSTQTDNIKDLRKRLHVALAEKKNSKRQRRG
jgi:hypothetical protein